MQASSKHYSTLEKNYEAIQSVTAIVADTLGPDGLDVMLVDEFGSSFCTNDGVAILNNLQIKNPIAKYAKDAALAQEEKVGDGTTSVCVMLEAMLAKSLEKISSEDISVVQLAKELQSAKDILISDLRNYSKSIESLEDSQLFFASRVAARNDEDLSELVTELYRDSFKNYIGDLFDLSDHIHGYKNKEEQIIEGLLLKKKAHLNKKTRVTNGNLLMIKGSFEPQPMSSEAASTDEGVRKFSNNVQEILEVCKKIKRKNIDAVFCSGSVFQQAEELLIKEGIFVISHLTEKQFNNIQRLSKAKPVTRSELFEQDQNFFLDKIGEFKSISWDEDLRAFIIAGAKFNFHSLILSQSTQTLLDERVRVAQDAAKVFLATFKEGFSEGGGIAEILTLRDYKEKNPNSIILDIVEAALSSIYQQIKTNSSCQESFDELREKYKKAQVIDSTRVKSSIISIAFDLCSQIIKVKSIVSANNY